MNWFVLTDSAPPSLFGRINRGLTGLRNLTLNTLFVLLLIAVIALAVGSCQQISVPQDAALVLNPEGVVVERAAVIDPLQQVLRGPAQAEVELHSVLTAITRAATDERIKALVLDFDELVWAAPAHAERIGQALQAFKSTGKEIVAYGYFFDQSSYQMASFANALYLHPQGQVSLFGFGNYSFYIKELLDKFKINVHIFRVGEFKSAVEPFTRSDMSPEARLANSALYDTLWQNTLAVVADNRQLPAQQVARYATHYDSELVAVAGDPARVALEQHLVDELLTDDQARVRIGDMVGLNSDGDINGIGYLTYLEAIGAQGGTLPQIATGEQRIAVLVAQGVITNANHNNGVIGAQATIEQIRQVRRDPAIKALVVRVDSPGGSQFASELIRQELELVQLAGKPVVVSFGASAASGGYWIAATSDHIVAQRNTVTGSIGIFALTTTFEDSLKELGIHTDGVGTAPMSQGLNPFAGLNEPVKRVIQAQVDHGYRQFIELVARGRGLGIDTVEGMAQGRVWSGEVAHELGLVDSLGGVDTALLQAAQLANLTDWQPQWLSEPLDPRQLLMRQLLSSQTATPTTSQSSQLQATLAPLHKAWSVLSQLDDPKRLYTLCDSCPWYPGPSQSLDAFTLFQ